MKTEFPRARLAAAVCFSGKKDIRYYLNGVLCECLPAETRLTATNGNIAGVTRYTRVNENRFEVIIPLEAVLIALKMKGNYCQLECNEGRWSIDGLSFTPVDGKFPDYRRIVPASCSGEAAPGFSPELLGAFAKAGKALGLRSHPIVRQNGKDPALVHFYGFDHFVGVLMPYTPFNAKTPDLGTPSWGAERV